MINGNKTSHHGLPWGVGYFIKGPVITKLSNSGEALELLVPNNIRNNICGWNNQSCKVISLKVSEKSEGNRGSKSSVATDSKAVYIGESVITFVKEQRVDGSWQIGGAFCLRCTLLGFKKNSRVKVLSNQINKVKWYTSVTNTSRIVESNLSKTPVWQPRSFSLASPRNKLEGGRKSLICYRLFRRGKFFFYINPG